MIPYGKHQIDQSDIDAVAEVLENQFLTQGEQVPLFEAEIAARSGSRHGIAVNSATSALHVACLALGLGDGSRVWTSPITFVASANAALYCGAAIDFVDIDPATANIDPARLEQKLIEADKAGQLPDALIAVHMAGRSCAMDAIADLARHYGFKVIEDASHALGAQFDGTPVGDCRHADMAVFSFHPVKMITTAEGGMITTNDDALASRARLFRTHGIARPGHDDFVGTPDGPWHYQQLHLGYNYRLSDLHAALGRNQLNRLGEFIASREQVARRYEDHFAGEAGMATPGFCPRSVSSWHLYLLRATGITSLVEKKALFEAFHASGIGVALHYMPVYRHPYYQSFGFDPAAFPGAEQFYREAISLPIFHGLAEADQATVIDTVTRLLR